MSSWSSVSQSKSHFSQYSWSGAVDLCLFIAAVLWKKNLQLPKVQGILPGGSLVGSLAKEGGAKDDLGVGGLGMVTRPLGRDMGWN